MTFVLTALIAACVVMVVAMLPYAKALLVAAVDDAQTDRGALRTKAAPLSALAQVSRAVFYAAWIAIVALVLALLFTTPGALTAANAAVAVAVIGGWWLLFCGIIWFARALARANARSGRASGRLAARDASVPPVNAHPAAPVRATPSAASAGRLQLLWFWGGIIALFLPICGLGAAFPAVGRWIDQQQQFLLVLSAGLGGAGFLLLLTGVIVLVLREGHPTTPDDARRLYESRMNSGALLSWSKSYYWFKGDALSRSVNFEFNVADIKAAWRAGAWRTDPTWRAITALLIGVALFAVAAALFFVGVAAPIGRAFILAVALYVALRLGWTLWRA